MSNELNKNIQKSDATEDESKLPIKEILYFCAVLLILKLTESYWLIISLVTGYVFFRKYKETSGKDVKELAAVTIASIVLSLFLLSVFVPLSCEFFSRFNVQIFSKKLCNNASKDLMTTFKEE